MVVEETDALDRRGRVGGQARGGGNPRRGDEPGVGGARLYRQRALLHRHGDGDPPGPAPPHPVEHLPLAPYLELARQFVLVEAKGRARFAVQARVAQTSLSQGVHYLNLPVGGRPHALSLPEGKVLVVGPARCPPGQFLQAPVARVAQRGPVGHVGGRHRAVVHVRGLHPATTTTIRSAFKVVRVGRRSLSAVFRSFGEGIGWW